MSLTQLSCSGEQPLALRRQRSNGSSLPTIPRLNGLKQLERRRRRRTRSNIYPTSPREQQKQNDDSPSESPVSARRRKLLRERKTQLEHKTESARRACFVRYDIGCATACPRSVRMFEKFLIVGGSKKSGDVMQILFEHPPPPTEQRASGGRKKKEQPAELSLVDKVLQHCGIMGVKRGVVHRYHYPFFPRADHRCNSFVISVAHENRIFYVACVVNEEPWDYYFTDSDSHRAQTEHAQQWWPTEEQNYVYDDSRACAGDTVIVSLRYYCVVTTLPSLDTHFELLYNVLEREKINFQERMHFFDDDDDGSNTTTSALLNTYYNKPAPSPKSMLSFSMRHNVRDSYYYVPMADSNELLGQWCLPTLVDLLRPKDILLLLGCLMQERSVLVHGPMPLLVSKLVFSMVCMLRPFAWQGIIVALVKETMVEVLDSPVPILAGVSEKKTEIRRYPSHFVHVVVNVQKDGSAAAELLLPEDRPLTWKLPLIKPLQTVLKSIRSDVAGDCKRLLDAFKHYQMELIFTMGKHVHIRTTSYMLFCGDVPSEKKKDGTGQLCFADNDWIDQKIKDVKERAFWHAMVDTQYFKVHCHSLATAFVDIHEILKADRGSEQHKHQLALRCIERIFCPEEEYEGDSDSAPNLDLRRSQSEHGVCSRRRRGTVCL